jgi:hypothetical protein
MAKGKILERQVQERMTVVEGKIAEVKWKVRHST